ncbi:MULTISPECIES: bile acid:sodium symporter family protein [Pseudoalteromonas]|uniref:bile acid:sodium symporter family protein n=1 Tax=Pseudoalteromonas TaxID=53246 RepID=UPI000FFF0C62|nr:MULTISPECIES: bile acid:sodium symporter family protein [Pseudoalteromonas]MCG9761212.1 bile acid:sodium symporter family protein [Pseudoalteromonas sp. Isolate6]NKC20703.1 bile acid:sodium symporter [Pseudoalteromonas galatheae]RXE87105.1 bile acid:sodium symporter [Pseudoalteromonas sp. A757]
MTKIVQLFPLWAIICSVIAYLFPTLFSAFKSGIIPLLMLIMLTMGLTLTTKDFLRVLDNKKAIFVSVLLQFTVMPSVAYLIATTMSLETDLLIGMILVGTVAGGTASNVLCYLAKGDVALSISMTAISTLLGVFLTPLITTLMIGQVVDIQFSDMLISLLKIVLLPVTVGVAFNTLFAKPLTHSVIKTTPILPLLSMLSIVFIIAVIVALNQPKLQSIGLVMLVAVILHNTTGLLLGYFIPKQLGFDEKVCRTMAFEVGMQNSGLAVALAMKFFTPAAAVAGTLFSIWHNVSGSILAGIWRRSATSSSDNNKA